MSLSEAKQDELYAFLDGYRGEGLRGMRERLFGERKIRVSLSTLSNWLNYYAMRSKLSQVRAMADSVAKVLKSTPGLDLEDSKIQRATQAFFEAKAMEDNDAKVFVQLAGVRKGAAELKLKERQIAIEEEKLRRADKAEAVASSSTLTPAEKEAKLKAIFGLS